MLKEGDLSCDFRLKGIDGDGNEGEFSLNDFRGRKLFLYFYPRDNTPGCTKEACAFRDSMNSLSAKGVTVIGISPDSIDSHKRFREKFNLNFYLLTDPDRVVAEAFGAYGEKRSYGKVSKGIIRSTFLIDESGRIMKAWRNVKVKGHVEEIEGYL